MSALPGVGMLRAQSYHVLEKKKRRTDCGRGSLGKLCDLLKDELEPPLPMRQPTRKPIIVSAIMVAHLNVHSIVEDLGPDGYSQCIPAAWRTSSIGERPGKRDALHPFIKRTIRMTQVCLTELQAQEEAMKNIQEAREMFVTTRSTQLYVRIAGNPEADRVLIMIHGGPGLSHRYLLDLEQLVGQELMVVSYDQRSSGRSSTPTAHGNIEQPTDFNLLTYSQDLEAVRSAVAGQKQVDLLGHSWGGLVALHYATLYPQCVRSLLLLGNIPPTWSGFQAGLGRFQKRLQALQQQGLIPLVLPTDRWEQIKCMFPAYMGDPMHPLSVEQFEYRHVIEQLTIAMIQGFDLTDQVARLPHRILILWGENDPFGKAWGEETQAALSDATVEFVVIPDGGHFGWMERPDAFAHSIRTFLGPFD